MGRGEAIPALSPGPTADGLPGCSGEFVIPRAALRPPRGFPSSSSIPQRDDGSDRVVWPTPRRQRPSPRSSPVALISGPIRSGRADEQKGEGLGTIGSSSIRFARCVRHGPQAGWRGTRWPNSPSERTRPAPRRQPAINASRRWRSEVLSKICFQALFSYPSECLLSRSANTGPCFIKIERYLKQTISTVFAVCVFLTCDTVPSASQLLGTMGWGRGGAHLEDRGLPGAADAGRWKHEGRPAGPTGLGPQGKQITLSTK